MTRIELPREKTVGHLTLLREPRPITAKEFNALTLDERVDIVRRARGMQKYNLLIEAADAEALVHRLSAQEVFLLIKELGPEDAAELLTLASAAQQVSFFDLDCWREDQFDTEAALVWLTLLAEGSEEHQLAFLTGVDFELLVLLVKKFLTVTGGPEEIEDEDVRIEAMRRDGGYVVEYTDPEHAKVIAPLLDLLFRQEKELFAQLMEAVRWELTSLLEENVCRLRRGRLLDRGFPDPFEAQEVYAVVDPATFDPAAQHKLPLQPAEEGGAAPGFYLSAARPRDLLADVLAGGISGDTAWELTFLVNKVLAADRVDMGDGEQVQAVMEEVYRYLNLGLEQLAGTDPTLADRLLREAYLEHLFRLGFSLTVQLRQRAERIERSPIGPFLDGPFRALVDALRRQKPRYYEGMDAENRGGERPFANGRDLQRAAAWLARLEIQEQLFAGLLGFPLPPPKALALQGCVPETADEVALSDLFLTALANRVLGRPFRPDPLEAAELVPLHGRICRQEKVLGELRQETRQWLEGLLPGAGEFGDYCLDLLEEAFCAVSPEDLDPRFLSGLILRLS